MAVEVKSVVVVESIFVPDASETPEVEMEFDPIVGSAVPPLTRAVLTVTVPASAMMCQPVTVQANGTVMYPTSEVVSAAPVATSPNDHPSVRVLEMEVTADSLTPSFVAGAATRRMPCVIVAGNFRRYEVPPVAGAARPALLAGSAGMLPAPAGRLSAEGVVPVPVNCAALTPPVPE